jgi:NADPH-dependent 2,4-dienoyl-CoA reductase/sulfur reductase-like enzyme
VIAAEKLKSTYDIAVIGAGPAGLAAGTIAARAGLVTVVIDENHTPGGQVYRAIATTPLLRREVLGADYWRGATLVQDFKHSGAEFLNGTTVWSVSRNLEIGISSASYARILNVRRIIIATGGLERPFPIPGWTLPGVMTVGGAQTLLKASGLVPKGRVVIVGSGPLLWQFAAQLLRAGGAIESILDTTPRGNYLRTTPFVPAFLVSPYLTKGLALLSEVCRKVRVVRHVTKVAALGDGKVSEIAFTVGGLEKRLPVDHLFLHQGVVPNINLTMSIGIQHRWDSSRLCWTPVVDEFGSSSIAGIAIAGDGAGVAGAWTAEERGRLAAMVAIETLGSRLSANLPSQQSVRRALNNWQAGRAFLDALYQPARQFRIPDADETIVCRCEEVTAGQIRGTLQLGCEGPNQVKSFLRCGMGPCQGRQCGLTVTELIAGSRGVSPDAVGYYRLRPPVKPIALAELATLPKTDAAIAAVIGGQ